MPLTISGASGKLAQSFQVSTAFSLGKLEFMILNGGGTATSLSVGVSSDTGSGQPNVADCFSEVTLPLAGTETNTWLMVDFHTLAPSLTQASTYWLVFRRTGTSNVDLVRYMSNNITTGNAYQSSDGVTFTVAGGLNDDMGLRLYSCDTPH